MKTIVLIGAGNMGGALLQGWIGSWQHEAAFHVIDPVAEASDRYPGVAFHAEAAALPAGLKPDVVILAVKPDKVVPALNEIAPHIGPATCIVSVAAGVGIDTIGTALPAGTPIARIMPNIGAMAGYAVSAGFAGPDVPQATEALLDDMFSAIGQMCWVENEDDLHTVTAISGSGPAYFFAFCETLRDAAMAHGLPAATAETLAVGTAISAGRLLEGSPTPEDLRHKVTSPNGTTAAGLAALARDNRLARLLDRTVDAAKARSVELSGAPKT